ncbi:MAG: DUF3108 domain-containing protein [Kofleriaceae bacterium]
MRSVALGLVAMVVTACGGGLAELDPAAPADPAAPGVGVVAAPAGITAVHPGEKMQFEVRLAGVLGGEATFVTGAFSQRDGRPVVVLSSSIHSAGALALVKDIRDEATTVLDLDALEPLSTSSVVRANPRDYTAETRFADQRAAIDFRPAQGDPIRLIYDFGDQIAHDAHSAMAQMRIWEAPAGATRTMWVLGGRRIWKVDLTMGPGEVIGTYGGNQATVRIDGVAYRAYANLRVDDRRPPRTFSVWMSDDADRVPFRVVAGTELGAVTIELVDYQRP